MLLSVFFFVRFLKKRRVGVGQPRGPPLKRAVGLVVGRKMKMPEFIWQWTDGLLNVTTSKVEVAERALKEGFLVIGRLVPQGDFS